MQGQFLVRHNLESFSVQADFSCYVSSKSVHCSGFKEFNNKKSLDSISVVPFLRFIWEGSRDV